MANQERVKLGVAALRSDRFKQGIGELIRVGQDGNRFHCCLGVFTEVAIDGGCEGIRRSADGRSFEILIDAHEEDTTATGLKWQGECDGDLPYAVQQWFEINDSNPELLVDDGKISRLAVELNDAERKDFTYIADAFERTFITK